MRRLVSFVKIAIVNTNDRNNQKPSGFLSNWADIVGFAASRESEFVSGVSGVFCLFKHDALMNQEFFAMPYREGKLRIFTPANIKYHPGGKLVK